MASRRDVLKLIAAGAVALTVWPRIAASATAAPPLLLVVMLRGGLDGLHALPPLGDAAWGGLRGALPFAPGDPKAKPLPIDRDFALHPSLAYASQLYRQKALLPVVAVAPPYQGRSHFEAQDCVENGSAHPNGAPDGWMNRCVASLHGEQGLAIVTAMPLIMRGAANVSTWSPPLPDGIDAQLLQRLDTLYAEDPRLAEAYARAVAESHEEGAGEAGDAGRGNLPDAGNRRAGAAGGLAAMMAAAGRFMARKDGAQIAFVEDSGWDTHAGEVAALQRKLGQLDAGLQGVHDALGAAWDRAAIAVVTEFGRTAKVNGTGGTDHGTGGIAFLAGGAIAGGRIAGRWPGLSAQDLNEGRDLHATTDLRALFKGLLKDHLGVAGAALDAAVFPGSAAVRPMAGLVRT